MPARASGEGAQTYPGSGEAEIGIGRDGALTEDEFVDPPWRHVDGAGESILAQAHRLQEVFEQDFARMRIWQPLIVCQTQKPGSEGGGAREEKLPPRAKAKPQMQK